MDEDQSNNMSLGSLGGAIPAKSQFSNFQWGNIIPLQNVMFLKQEVPKIDIQPNNTAEYNFLIFKNLW